MQPPEPALSENASEGSVVFSNVIVKRTVGAQYTFLNARIPGSNSRPAGVVAAPVIRGVI